MVDANDAYLSMSGYSREELLRLGVAEIERGEMPEQVEGHSEVLAAKGSDRFCSVHRRKDGSTYPVEVSIRCLPRPHTGYLVLVRDLSRARRAEQALREKTEELEKLFDVSLELLCIADTSGRFRRLNPEWERTLGFPRGELEGRRFLDLVHPDDLQSTQAAVAELAAQRSVVDFRNRYRRQDGTYRWLEWRSFPAGDLIYAAARDITARRETEDALTENVWLALEAQRVARLGAYVLEIPAGSWTSSPVLDEIFGIDEGYRRDVEGWLGIVHAEERQELESYFSGQVVAARQRFDKEYRIVRRGDATERWVHGRGRLFFDAAGRPVRMIGTIQDVTERKHAEQELQRSRSLYHDLVETAQDLIWQCDTEGRYVYLNGAFETVFGYQLEEMLGRPFTDFQEAARAAGDRDEFSRLVAGGTLRGYETEHLAKDGRRLTLVFNAKAVWDERGTVVGSRGTAYDVTERKRAEEDKLELERRLLHAQKLESLGVLAGGIAHDFNNLLMSILGNLDMALLRLSRPEAARASIEQAVSAVRRSAELARQMLAYAGRAPFVIKPLDLNLLVKENAELLRTTVARSISLGLRLADALPRVAADAAQVQQLIMNLITNASEAIGDRPGAITLATGVADFEATALARTRLAEAPPAGRYVFIEVTDTGAGMDEETQGRVFEPFFSTKFSGRGLGMAVVLGVVRGHGGALFVDSAPGQGTTITALLDARSAQPAEGVERAAPAAPAPSEPRALEGTVLLVDDEDLVRSVVRQLLEHMGLSVLAASDGQEGVELFRRNAERIDCVLLDLSMPRMDGLAALREMTRIRPGVKAILASGYARQDALQRFDGEGLAAFIQKPYGAEELRATLVAVMAAEDD